MGSVRNDPLDQSRQFIATDILSHPRGGEGWDFVAVRVMEIGSDLFCVLSLVFPPGIQQNILNTSIECGDVMPRNRSE